MDCRLAGGEAVASCQAFVVGICSARNDPDFPTVFGYETRRLLAAGDERRGEAANAVEKQT